MHSDWRVIQKDHFPKGNRILEHSFVVVVENVLRAKRTLLPLKTIELRLFDFFLGGGGGGWVALGGCEDRCQLWSNFRFLLTTKGS